jgi:glucose-6-phosphate isomerase
MEPSMNIFIKDKKLNETIAQTLSKLSEEKIVERIWNKDYTVWDENPDEISNRLGWLDSVEATSKAISEIKEFVQSVINEGFTQALLMGMGGSSLAPEVFRLTFGVKDAYLDLAVIDSTHPEVVKEFNDKLEFEKTLFIVSTKSGGTVETISLMKYFYNNTLKEIGKDNVGKHFIAITDPGSGLEKMAKDLTFRKVFLNDPNIGGRYSALSLFGMVPAALVGIDVNQFLTETKIMVEECKNNANNSAAELGIILSVLANEKIDKVTFITSPEIKYFGAWVEQLVAESTGKNGKGILPVDFEEVLTPEFYSKDRLFVYMKMKNDSTCDLQINTLKDADFPIIEIELNDIYDLGKEYFRWEFATIIAGWALGIQPFDQPNVESAKVVARKMMGEYKEKGKLPELIPNFTEDGISVLGNIKSHNLKDSLNEFLQNVTVGKSYVAIHAYLKPEKETTNQLQSIRTAIQKKFKVATTVGYGPRFLHSTGQLHKGDAGNGLFIQIIGDPNKDLPIPDVPQSDESSITFGVLIRAQAMGDREALFSNNRNVLTLDLGTDLGTDLQQNLKYIEDLLL